MKYPQFLNKKENNITLIAPSFGCTTEPYNSRLKLAIKHFNDLGLNIIKGPNIFNTIGFRSNTNLLCAKEFMDNYLSNTNLLMSVGGGNLMNEILDDIDFNLIKDSPPKWFMGYSDNTNLTFTLTTLCDVATLYGPCAPEFGQTKLDLSLLKVIDLLKGKKLEFKGYSHFELQSLKTEDNPYVGYNYDTVKKLVLNQNKIEMEGRLLGGCIDCLTYIIGTPYDKVKEFNAKYKDDGIIWFLEACDLEAWNLKLALLQMKRCGWFENAKGFIFGRPLKYNTDFIGLTMDDAVLDVLNDLNVPIIINADFGHLKPQIPIICGSVANIKAKDNNLKISYKLI